MNDQNCHSLWNKTVLLLKNWSLVLCYVHTWKEFMIVNIQMKKVVLTSTANIPMIHVIPNSGSNTTAPLIAVLKRHNELKNYCSFQDTYIARSVFFTSYSAPPLAFIFSIWNMVTTRITELNCHKNTKIIIIIIIILIVTYANNCNDWSNKCPNDSIFSR